MLKMIQLFFTHGERGGDPCKVDSERVNDCDARCDAINNYSKESSISSLSESDHGRDGR